MHVGKAQYVFAGVNAGPCAFDLPQAVRAEGCESKHTALPEHPGDFVKNRLRVWRPRKHLVRYDHIE